VEVVASQPARIMCQPLTAASCRCCCGNCRAADKGPLDVKCVNELPAKDTAITIANTSADTSSEGSGSAAPPSPVVVEGAKPPGVFRGMFNSVRKSAVWRTLNYSMDYDIHKVRGCQVWCLGQSPAACRVRLFQIAPGVAYQQRWEGKECL
jgi:hypothetical protein